MKKLSCPKCGNKWDKDARIVFHIKAGMPFTITEVKIQDLIFCPVCFFTTKGKNNYEAKLDRVVLEEGEVKIKDIVVRDEFGRYIDMNSKDFKKLRISSFGEEEDNGDIDDFNSLWGGAGPDCSSKRVMPVTQN